MPFSLPRLLSPFKQARADQIPNPSSPHPTHGLLVTKMKQNRKRGKIHLHFICLCVVSCVLVCYVARSDVQQRVRLGSWIVR